MKNYMPSCMFGRISIRPYRTWGFIIPQRQFDILSLNSAFCLLPDFRPTRENRLKSSRWHFSTPRRFDALRTKAFYNCLTHNGLFFMHKMRCAMHNGRIAKYTCQNRPFHRLKSPFSAWEVSNLPQAKNQTPHAEMAIAACGNANRRTRRLESSPAKLSIPAF